MSEPAPILRHPNADATPSYGGVDVLDRVLMEWARAKIQRLDILNYNGANLANLHAHDMAKKMGFNPSAIGVTPYPSPSVTNISMEQRQPAPEPQPATPAPPPAKWPQWLTLVAALAAGAGAAAGGSWLYQNWPQQSVVDTEYEVRFFDKDGNPIVVPQKK